MKEKARNVKTDKKYWIDPMSSPLTPRSAAGREITRMSRRGADMKKERIEKGIKAYRRGRHLV